MSTPGKNQLPIREAGKPSAAQGHHSSQDADPVGTSVAYPLGYRYRNAKNGYGKGAVPATEVPDGRMWNAPQIGFTLEAKVEIPGQAARMVRLYVDSGSPLTWLEDRGNDQPFDDASHQLTIHYGDKSAFRGLQKTAKITVEPSSPNPVVLENITIGLGHLYENIPAQISSNPGSPMQIDTRSRASSGTTTPESSTPGSPLPTRQTSEMGDGLVGFSPKVGSKGFLYNINHSTTPAKEVGFTRDIDTLMTGLGKGGMHQRVFFHFTPHGKESDAEIMFGELEMNKTSGRVEKRSAVKKRDTGNWRLDTEIKIGNTVIVQKTDAHLDTGYSRIGLPRAAYKEYKRRTGAHNEANRLVLTHEQFNNLEPLTITFKEDGKADVSFVLSPDAQLWPRDYNEREGFTRDQYVLAIGDAGDGFVIGAAASKFVPISFTSFSDSLASSSALLHMGL